MQETLVDIFDLSTDNVIALGSETYTLNIGDTQIGNGNIILLKKRLGRAGTVPPANAANIIEMNRYGATTEDNLVKAVFQIW